ncbi:uncharacterized protein FIBRA_06297 [Fibroporia radiculosa]|uniref:Helicase ATP-binding domain-containing protein n=1 Tax=Fibroporia radiculosa TaxID=599839 RepID=J4GSH6_9APHY|nr:uncharacterized protein FIBRA_06297 [Fibroporia radiculosa]CCM04135.1 predicted protein [Fibroporia radiculosa]
MPLDSKLKASRKAASDRSRKFEHSEPIPLAEDSDSDFNPGSFTYEPPKKGKKDKRVKVSAGTSIISHRKHKLRREHQTAIAKSSGSKLVTTTNPLLEYFATLDLHSASEDENQTDNEEPSSEDEAGSAEENVQDIQPGTMLRTYTALMRPSEATRLRDHKNARSETEPESELECTTTSTALKRKSPESPFTIVQPQSKRLRFENSDNSVTESESELELAPAIEGRNRSAVHVKDYGQATKSGPKTTKSTDTASDTESDSEAEVVLHRSLEPKPAFKLKLDQQTTGPLTLDNSHSVPAQINTFLRDYQREGIRFFFERYKTRRGGILGDDMGLKNGDKRDIDRRRKHVSRLQDEDPSWKRSRTLPPANDTWPTCLIISPSSVVGNWEREFETWGYFEVGIYTGLPKERADVLRDFKMGRLDVVVTSFETARNDIALLDDLAWSCIVIDEVHRVKNPRSALAAAFSRFICTIRFGLTGTAIQNSFQEFWTILDWANPGSVGTKNQWEGFVSRPLTVGQSKSATEEQRTKGILVAQILTDKLLPKFFLRRTKDIIKNQLPGKDDQVVFCPLTATQIEVYKRILNMEPVQNMMRKDEPCDCGSKEKRRKCCHPFDRGDLFRYLVTLIKISNHLALILPSPSDTPEQTARNRELSRIAFGNETIPKYGPSILTSRFCGKWTVLESLLEDWKKDALNKVLIFTKSIKLLEMLEFHLRSRSEILPQFTANAADDVDASNLLDTGYVKLDGSTKASDRMSLIDRFHEDPHVSVFLISTLAGGTGLNLTGANKVTRIGVSLLFYPAHDLQAIDRAYRFGQTRSVSVFRLLGAGSIEELIYARQVYKQQQMQVGYNASFQTRYFEGVQGEKSKQGELFGLKNIFTLHESALATKKAVEKAVLSDFNWALANVDANKSGLKTKHAAEANAKDDDNLRGLDTLLFDDGIPEVEKKDDGIQKILSDVGVTYIHRNADLIAESAVEGHRFQSTMEVRKKSRKNTKQARGSTASKAEVEEQWPPQRRHHKPKPTPEERLKARLTSLIELGYIATAEHLSAFLERFMRWSLDDQQQFFAELDAYHAARNRPS